ncbi:MAG: hypothetical protein ACFB9M_07290 [Myxococcota bacterium]
MEQIRKQIRVWLLALGAGAACAAPVGVRQLRVPSDGAETCQKHCGKMGLELGAVAIMADNVGCVCQPVGTNTSTNAGAVTAGMATVMLQNAAELQRQQDRAQQRRN